MNQMGVPHELRADMSVTDLAYCILKNRGKAMAFKDLMTEIMQVKALNPENRGRLGAQIHTEINLDSRFLHQGGGEWGLRDWQPKQSKVVRIEKPSAPAASRRSALLRDEEDDDDEEFRYGYDSDDEEELNEESDDYDKEKEDLYDEDE